MQVFTRALRVMIVVGSMLAACAASANAEDGTLVRAPQALRASSSYRSLRETVPQTAPAWRTAKREELVAVSTTGLGLGQWRYEPQATPISRLVLTDDGDDLGQPELPPITVEGRRLAPTTNSRSSFARVGPNHQPAWTTHRRFPSTRAYVKAPWQLEFESWWEGKFKKDETNRQRYLEELSIGLPGRFQVDLYWRIQTQTGEDTRYEDFQIEGRWALAPWDCIPLNPTVYAEYKIIDDGADIIEGKLLFADDIGRRGMWAFNLFWEKQLGEDQEIEQGFSAAAAFTVCDPSLSLGVETKFEHVTAKGARDDPEIELLLGPSIQWRPGRAWHIDVAPLFGLTEDSPIVQIYIVVGFDILPGRSRSASLPTSSRAR